MNRDCDAALAMTKIPSSRTDEVGVAISVTDTMRFGLMVASDCGLSDVPIMLKLLNDSICI